ncbi:uncharacterized protein E0L32_008036 [Thyridium curvatum]|uniref:Uncharacterized protein n=1 Tax=Thyridium curvatum TaxID=1093900 RepID=A0A507B153_9PEZI|nr:uncharacterized protein E0L32_008036 [Thyridium curvatum]TPX10999.1 hypothetical protein E0L32_008036 [Thyridium curvatum]
MRQFILLLALLGAALVSADVRTASIYIQPIGSGAAAKKPALLAEVRYDALDPSSAEVSAYEAPYLPDDGDGLVRVGVWDAKTRRWAGSTSVAAARNFAKGYSPHLTLSVDARGSYLGAACRGVRIDAGATRDFGPQARVVVAAQGKQPDLNKPVVLSPEGRKVQPEQEKTFLQKYWWLIGVGVLLLATGGGGDK